MKIELKVSSVSNVANPGGVNLTQQAHCSWYFAPMK